MRRWALLITLAGVLLLTGSVAAAASGVSRCRPVANPYPGSRYEGVDLRRILARNTSCRTARRVARGAHRKALALPVPVSGIRRFAWRGWRVTGNVRGATDRYLATRGRKRVRWLF